MRYISVSEYFLRKNRRNQERTTSGPNVMRKKRRPNAYQVEEGGDRRQRIKDGAEQTNKLEYRIISNRKTIKDNTSGTVTRSILSERTTAPQNPLHPPIQTNRIGCIQRATNVNRHREQRRSCSTRSSSPMRLPAGKPKYEPLSRPPSS